MGEKGRAEWREWSIQIFEIWIRSSDDEGRCVLLPGHLLCHMEVREEEGVGPVMAPRGGLGCRSRFIKSINL
jgi:hypothetical protein